MKKLLLLFEIAIFILICSCSHATIEPIHAYTPNAFIPTSTITMVIYRPKVEPAVTTTFVIFTPTPTTSSSPRYPQPPLVVYFSPDAELIVNTALKHLSQCSPLLYHHVETYIYTITPGKYADIDLDELKLNGATYGTGIVYLSEKYILRESFPSELRIFLTMVTIVHESRHNEMWPDSPEWDAYQFSLRVFDDCSNTLPSEYFSVLNVARNEIEIKVNH